MFLMLEIIKEYYGVNAIPIHHNVIFLNPLLFQPQGVNFFAHGYKLLWLLVLPMVAYSKPPVIFSYL